MLLLPLLLTLLLLLLLLPHPGLAPFNAVADAAAATFPAPAPIAGAAADAAAAPFPAAAATDAPATNGLCWRYPREHSACVVFFTDTRQVCVCLCFRPLESVEGVVASPVVTTSTTTDSHDWAMLAKRNPCI